MAHDKASKSMIEKKIRENIKIFHSIGGKELLDHEFNVLHEEHGTRRWLSCPYTH